MTMTCKVCGSGPEVRHDVDLRALNGEPLRAIASTYEFSRESIRRHLQAHVAPEVRQALAETRDLDASSLALRVVGIANRVADASENAESKDVARLADSELRALNMLSVRLGLDNDAIEQDVARMLAAWKSIHAILRDHPDLRPEFAAELREHPSGEYLAEIVERQIKEISE